MNWIHFKTILWLRWRLSRNQVARGGTLNAVLGVILLVAGVLAAIGGALGGIWLGSRALANVSPSALLLVWDGIFGAFLFFWLIGIISDIQRSESLDLSRLLHLPVSLPQVFTINFIASHVTPSLILVVPAMLGLSVGLAFGRGPHFALLIPLALGSIFMITAWTYCLRGWLVSLMVNQRRRRAIIMGVTAGFIVLVQVPNFYFNVMRPDFRKRTSAREQSSNETAAPRAAARSNEIPAGLLTAHTCTPPLWLAHGAMSLALGKVAPALWGALGAFAIGAAGLWRAYRATVRFHRGEASGKSRPQPSAKPSRRRPARNWLEVELPRVPAEAAPVALASLRSMSRAPEVKMALLTPLIMMVVFGMLLFGRHSAAMPEITKPLITTGAVVFSLFGLIQFMFNQFGFDRDGFRALILLPARRRNYLLGKNLSLLPLILLIGLLFLAVLKVAAKLTLVTMLAGVFQLVAAFLLLSTVGNFISIMVPYRIAAGSLKPTKTPWKTAFLIFATHLLFPVTLIPVFIPPVCELLFGVFGGPAAVPVNLVLSALLALAGGMLYGLSLENLGALLHRREQRILQTVTQEVE